MESAQVSAGRGADGRPASSLRGEAVLPIGGRSFLLRPTFAALVAAEEELGSLFALVERAGEGRLRLSELARLFWHCLAEPGDVTQAEVGDAVVALGLAGCAAPLRVLLGEILRGRA